MPPLSPAEQAFSFWFYSRVPGKSGRQQYNTLITVLLEHGLQITDMKYNTPDTQVIEMLRLFVTELYKRNKQLPITGDAIRRFLLHHIPTSKVEPILSSCIRANILEKVERTDDLWRPISEFSPSPDTILGKESS